MGIVGLSHNQSQTKIGVHIILRGYPTKCHNCIVINNTLTTCNLFFYKYRGVWRPIHLPKAAFNITFDLRNDPGTSI